MSDRRLLISFAHPDDESFGLGGLIAKYVAEGVDVYLICATDGDVGTVPEKFLNGNQSIREIRLAELECAATKLGFKQVFTFGYKDSGMVGSDTLSDPDCLWYRWENEPEQVTSRVVDVIREIKPQVVITFNRYGGYGHPDHIAIQRATVEAFQLAGDPQYNRSALPPHSPQKLYFNSIPGLLLRVGIWFARLRRQDPRRLGVNKDIDLVKIVDYIEPTHARVPISGYLDAWDEANACHESQGGGRAFGQFPNWIRHRIISKQGFTRIYPKPDRDVVDETDLFAAVVS